MKFTTLLTAIIITAMSTISIAAPATDALPALFEKRCIADDEPCNAGDGKSCCSGECIYFAAGGDYLCAY